MLTYQTCTVISKSRVLSYNERHMKSGELSPWEVHFIFKGCTIDIDSIRNIVKDMI